MDQQKTKESKLEKKAVIDLTESDNEGQIIDVEAEIPHTKIKVQPKTAAVEDGEIMSISIANGDRVTPKKLKQYEEAFK